MTRNRLLLICVASLAISCSKAGNVADPDLGAHESSSEAAETLPKNDKVRNDEPTETKTKQKAMPNNELSGPAAAVQKHLATVQPGVEFSIIPQEFGIEGWSFIETNQLDLLDGTPYTFVVRGTETVILENKEAELSKIFVALDLQKADLLPAETMARAASALLANNRTLISTRRATRFARRIKEIEGPKAKRTDGIISLTFWVHTNGRRFVARRFEVTMGTDNKITHTTSTP